MFVIDVWSGVWLSGPELCFEKLSGLEEEVSGKGKWGRGGGGGGEGLNRTVCRHPIIALIFDYMYFCKEGPKYIYVKTHEIF